MEVTSIPGPSSLEKRKGILTRSFRAGARGIDYMELFTTASSQWVKFPLYDGHGNMIATIKRAGAGNSSFTTGDARTYDVWGGIRSGSATSSPDQRYCANLGHRVDDESEGLIYMRARYYEPWTGRFVSRDAALHGYNWFTYCGSDPVNRVDETGNWDSQDTIDLIAIIAGLISSKLFMLVTCTLVVSGLLVFITPVGTYFAYLLIMAGVAGVADHLSMSAKEGLLPKFGLKDRKLNFRVGLVFEIIGFFAAWYGLLDFLYRHIDLLTGDDGTKA